MLPWGDVTFTRSPRSIPICFAVSADTSTQTSHVTWVTGSGVSWSHDLSASRPSKNRSDGYATRTWEPLPASFTGSAEARASFRSETVAGAAWRHTPAAPQRLLPELGERLAAPVFFRALLPLLIEERAEAGPLERALALLVSQRLATRGKEDVPRRAHVDRPAVDGHRPHGRLHQADHAVLGFEIPPGLERVKRGKHDVGARRGLARAARQRDDHRHLGQGLREARLGRHRVQRVDVDEHEHVDLALLHRLGQLHHLGVRRGATEGGIGAEPHRAAPPPPPRRSAC